MSRLLALLAAGALVASPVPTAAETASPSPAPTATGVSAWTGVSWSRVSALPKGAEASDLIEWNGTYVLVGAEYADRSGRQRAGAWSSTDLATWSRTLTAGGTDGIAAFTSVVALPDRLVALGHSWTTPCGGSILPACGAPEVIVSTSSDGETWEQLPPGIGAPAPGTVAAAAYGHDLILAVGDQGWSTPAIWRSTDGLHWETGALPAEIFADAHLFSVTPFSGGWVVTGMTGGHELHCCDDGWKVDETQPAAWWSADGLTWQRATFGAGASEWGARLGDVFEGPAGLVAVDLGDPVATPAVDMSPGASLPMKPRMSVGHPQVWTSADGRTWAWVSVDPDTAFRPIASDGTGILGRSAHGDLAISANGITWRTLPAEGKAPGSHGLMEWGNMSPSWRTENGLVAQGVDAQGGRTRKLLLAAPTIP